MWSMVLSHYWDIPLSLVPCFRDHNGPSIDLPGTRRDNGTTHCRRVPGTSHHGPSYFPLGPYMVFPLVNGSSLLIEYMSHSVWGSSTTFFPLATVMEHSLSQNFEINFSHLN